MDKYFVKLPNVKIDTGKFLSAAKAIHDSEWFRLGSLNWVYAGLSSGNYPDLSDDIDHLVHMFSSAITMSGWPIKLTKHLPSALVEAKRYNVKSSVLFIPLSENCEQSPIVFTDRLKESKCTLSPRAGEAVLYNAQVKHFQENLTDEPLYALTIPFCSPIEYGFLLELYNQNKLFAQL